ncbi:MAG: amidohydrolase family protein [Desulfobacterota bacterium]|nr:amidohydrolase family protein [Thermodesulfobacteriota bacterium]MDW8001250.1 adenine deaminase C-terminal domain-containing protein [Deltaproteobacteria bacterium]
MDQFMDMDRRRVLESYLKKGHADLVLTNGNLINVYTKEILNGYSVAIKDRWIIRVDKDVSSVIGPETLCLDVEGKYIVPGFIDGHAHILSYCHPQEILYEVAKRGVTTVVTELLDLSFKVDLEGMEEYLEATKGAPCKVFATIPVFITLSEASKKRTPEFEKILNLLKREDVLGLGESFWQEVLRGHELFFRLAPYALRMRKTIEGHSAGCKGEKLQIYAFTGVSSCHEPISYEEVVERLRLGLYVMVREGSVRSDIGCLAELKRSGLDTRRIILVSDFMSPEEILSKGYMEYVVSRAIDNGIDPVSAIQMVTLNPASHFGLDNVLGGIAPGKYADLVVSPSLTKIEPQTVISGGRIVVENGNSIGLKERKPLRLQGFKRPFIKTQDLIIRAPKRERVKVRLVEQVTDLITRESIKEIVPKDGELTPNPEEDILRLSYVTTEGCYNYLIKSFGLKTGALATSSLWEAYGVLAVGVRIDDLCIAINRIIELGGGIVIVDEGRIVEELPLPIGSLISDLPFEEVAKRISFINGEAKKRGVRWNKPIMTLETLTTPAIPFLRVSDRGLVDLRQKEALSFIVD